MAGRRGLTIRAGATNAIDNFFTAPPQSFGQCGGLKNPVATPVAHSAAVPTTAMVHAAGMLFRGGHRLNFVVSLSHRTRHRTGFLVRTTSTCCHHKISSAAKSSTMVTATWLASMAQPASAWLRLRLLLLRLSGSRSGIRTPPQEARGKSCVRTRRLKSCMAQLREAADPPRLLVPRSAAIPRRSQAARQLAQGAWPAHFSLTDS
jgi:hypothetical protein